MTLIPFMALHRARVNLADTLQETLATELLRLEGLGISLAEVGKRIGRSPEDTKRLVFHPERWTLADVSDLWMAVFGQGFHVAAEQRGMVPATAVPQPANDRQR